MGCTVVDGDMMVKPKGLAMFHHVARARGGLHEAPALARSADSIIIEAAEHLAPDRPRHSLSHAALHFVECACGLGSGSLERLQAFERRSFTDHSVYARIDGSAFCWGLPVAEAEHTLRPCRH